MIHQVEGDVFAALRRLPAAWAHGIVTDPPYGWGFMGREFDSQHRRRAALDEQALYAGWLTDAERRARGVRPMTDGERYALWSLGWLREAYRVLVPGGVLLGFQGAKSYDAFAFAGRLAGFEVLPTISGITGQAMAQGGNLGKLIDRERTGGHATVLDGTRWIRERMEARGLRPADLNAATNTQMAGHWTSRGSQPAIPTAEQWSLLESLLGPPPPWLDAMILPAFEPGEAWAF